MPQHPDLDRTAHLGHWPLRYLQPSLFCICYLSIIAARTCVFWRVHCRLPSACSMLLGARAALPGDDAGNLFTYATALTIGVVPVAERWSTCNALAATAAGMVGLRVPPEQRTGWEHLKGIWSTLLSHFDGKATKNGTNSYVASLSWPSFSCQSSSPRYDMLMVSSSTLSEYFSPQHDELLERPKCSERVAPTPDFENFHPHIGNGN